MQSQGLQRIANKPLSAGFGDEVCFIWEKRCLIRRAAGADNDPRLGPACTNGVSQIATIHRARHVHISVEERYTFVGL